MIKYKGFKIAYSNQITTIWNKFIPIKRITGQLESIGVYLAKEFIDSL